MTMEKPTRNTVYFLTMDDLGLIQIHDEAVTPVEAQLGFMHGEIYIQPWEVFHTWHDANSQRNTLIVDIGSPQITEAKH